MLKEFVIKLRAFIRRQPQMTVYFIVLFILAAAMVFSLWILAALLFDVGPKERIEAKKLAINENLYKNVISNIEEKKGVKEEAIWDKTKNLQDPFK